MRSTITAQTFYHIYPLGACGAPARNDFSSPAGTGLRSLIRAIPRLHRQGITALYIGPLFESTAHGYDTVDYYWVDRRLGTNDDLKDLVDTCHASGIKVVLDAVLNHTGRHFFAFRDLQEKGSDSAYKAWFRGVDFTRHSPKGDHFFYEGWSGHYDLVKLDTENASVREHLFGAVRYWIEYFGIDGLRLDAADVLTKDFMDALASFTHGINPDFWLMGEVVHGDYRDWAKENRLDSVTNYELYKGLWSSFKDRNFFEIAWTLNRQFGAEGLYRHIALYNFADNHDVNRVASELSTKSHLFPLYGLLFTVPGIPSVYYGSEWGIEGMRGPTGDTDLRPQLELASSTSPVGSFGDDLARAIARFNEIRKEWRALRDGAYRQLHVASEQFAFARELPAEAGTGAAIIIAVNASLAGAEFRITGVNAGYWKDVLNDDEAFTSNDGSIRLAVPPSWLRILVLQ